MSNQVFYGSKIRGRITQLVPVKPDCVHLLIYQGGHCGEFIGYWLSQHPGCIGAVAETLPNNRYVHRFTQKFVISTTISTAWDEHLFLLAHPGSQPKDTTTFNGIPLSDIQHHSYISCSESYKKFFFLLMWIKMRLYKFPMSAANADSSPWLRHIAQQFNDMYTVQDFRRYINGRSWFYQFELDSFKQDQPNFTVMSRAQQEYQFYNLLVEHDNLHRINLDQLMFGDTAQEHQRICEYYGLDYSLSRPLTPMIQAYHQRNLDIAQRYLDVPLDEFLAMSHEQAWPWVERALTRCHDMSLDLV